MSRHICSLVSRTTLASSQSDQAGQGSKNRFSIGQLLRSAFELGSSCACLFPGSRLDNSTYHCGRRYNFGSAGRFFIIYGKERLSPPACGQKLLIRLMQSARASGVMLGVSTTL